MLSKLERCVRRAAPRTDMVLQVPEKYRRYYDLDQQRDKETWLEARKLAHVTSSAAADYMFIGYGSMIDAIRKWHGTYTSNPNAFLLRAFETGHRNEIKARELLAKWGGCPITEVGFCLRECGELMFGASPDGVVWFPSLGGHACVEFKSPVSSMYPRPKPNHIVQMYMQMFATNTPICIYAVYFPPVGMHVWTVTFDDTVWEYITDNIADFVSRVGETEKDFDRKGIPPKNKRLQQFADVVESAKCVRRCTQEGKAIPILPPLYQN